MPETLGRRSQTPVDAVPFAHLELELGHRIGSLHLDVAFRLTQPWSLLFAPSGAGKTTILRAIAGLLKPQRARIVSRTQISPHSAEPVVSDFILTDTSARVFIPPQRRVIRMIGQNVSLFPHMNVLRNIRYGDTDKRQHVEENLESLLTLCRVAHLTAKMPSELSGGERQRVALARSLAAEGCRLLLLDEPFTGLDTSLRDDLIADLQSWLGLRNVPVLSVTHDITEAFHLNAEVLKLHEGRIIQQGPAATVLADERSRLLRQLR